MSISEIYLKYDIPTVITVQVDSREQYPLLFPKMIQIAHPERSGKNLIVNVDVEKKRLEFGDYRLKEYPDCCVIERKASQMELVKNIQDPGDSIRQAKAFRGLSACQYPYLLIEASPLELLQEGRYVSDSQRFMADLCLVIAKYRLRVIWMPWKQWGAAVRRRLGAVVVHLMFAHATHLSRGLLTELIGEGIIDDNEKGKEI